MRPIYFPLLILFLLTGCGENNQPADHTTKTKKKRLTIAEKADSLMNDAKKRCLLLDASWDTLSFAEAFRKARHDGNTDGFFYHNNKPYCAYSKREWNRMSKEEQLIAVRIAKQRYEARRLVKAFFMRYGAIYTFSERAFTEDDGVYLSYSLTAHTPDVCNFSVSFTIDLQRPRFKYYSTYQNLNRQSKNYYSGLGERGGPFAPEWIKHDKNGEFADITALAVAVKPLIDKDLEIAALQQRSN